MSKIPPQNREAEKGLLYILITFPEEITKVVNYLLPQDFSQKTYEFVYSAILALYDETSKIDLVTLADKLQFQGNFESIGEHLGLIQLMDVVGVSQTHVIKYSKLIKRASIRRKLMYAASQLETRALDEEEDIETIFSLHEFRFSQIETEYNLCFKEEGMRFDSAFEEVVMRREPGSKGAETGLIVLDENTMGLKRGHLWIMYAPPGSGKTFVSIQMAHHMLRQGKTVRFISLEMAAEEIWDRLIMLEQDGDFSDSLAYDRASEWNFIVEDKIFSMNQIKRYVKQHAKETEVFVIDYLGLIENELKLSEIENIILGSRELQKVAKKNNASLLVLAQPTTESPQDDYSVHIKGGSSVRAVADVIVKLQRLVDENHVESAYRETIKVILQKNKYGRSFKSMELNVNPKTGGMIINN